MLHIKISFDYCHKRFRNNFKSNSSDSVDLLFTGLVIENHLGLFDLLHTHIERKLDLKQLTLENLRFIARKVNS